MRMEQTIGSWRVPAHLFRNTLPRILDDCSVSDASKTLSVPYLCRFSSMGRAFSGSNGIGHDLGMVGGLLHVAFIRLVCSSSSGFRISRTSIFVRRGALR